MIFPKSFGVDSSMHRLGLRHVDGAETIFKRFSQKLRLLMYHSCIALTTKRQVTREKIEVVSGNDEQRQQVLIRHVSAEALEGGRLGCPGAPPFNAECYLAGGDAGGVKGKCGPPPP